MTKTKAVVGVESETRKDADEGQQSASAALALAPREGEEEAMCRICHLGKMADSSLVSPCRCSGTMALVHQACLGRWVLRSGGSLQCELCGYVFRARFQQRSAPFLRQAAWGWEALQQACQRFGVALTTIFSANVLLYTVAPLCCALIFMGIYFIVAVYREGFWPAIFAYKSVRNVSCFFAPSSVGVYSITLFASIGLCMLRAVYPQPSSTVLTFYSASVMFIFLGHAVISHVSSSQHHLDSEGHLVPGPAPVVPPPGSNATDVPFLVAWNGTSVLEDYARQMAALSLELPIPLGRYYLLAFFAGVMVLLYPLYCVVSHIREAIRMRRSFVAFEEYSKSRDALFEEAPGDNSAGCGALSVESPGEGGGEGQGVACPQGPHTAVQVEGSDDSRGEDGRGEGVKSPTKTT